MIYTERRPGPAYLMLARAVNAMSREDLKAQRRAVRLEADPKRVIARLFIPGDESRVAAILDRVLALSDADVSSTLTRVLERYSSRHKDIVQVLERHYKAVAPVLNGRVKVTRERRWLIGAYFTSEYSLESVALFNPTMVLHPDQSGMSKGKARFIMSLRACGEGHISSIEFRSGIIDSRNGITFDPVPPFAAAERPVDDHLHDKNRFYLKLNEMGAYSPVVDRILQQLSDEFTISDLERAIETVRLRHRSADDLQELTQTMLWLAHSSYRVVFPDDSVISERVIFPVTESESRGIEDARFVRFTYDDGRIVYYATYAAYNGFRSLPQFIETTDFVHFRVNTLNGQCAQNKGMALFPRKIQDRYVMISRMDGENIYLLRSDDIHFWNEAEKIRSPTHPWEFVQIGNCGSPLETDEGWLLLTHGVGPMREYWMGAMLLDLQNPSRVIGHLKDPILIPTEEERDGYVPNVVYSCGSMIHQDELIIPYGISDTSTSIATVSVPKLLSHLV